MSVKHTGFCTPCAAATPPLASIRAAKSGLAASLAVRAAQSRAAPARSCGRGSLSAR